MMMIVGGIIIVVVGRVLKDNGRDIAMRWCFVMGIRSVPDTQDHPRQQGKQMTSANGAKDIQMTQNNGKGLGKGLSKCQTMT